MYYFRAKENDKVYYNFNHIKRRFNMTLPHIKVSVHVTKIAVTILCQFEKGFSS